MVDLKVEVDCWNSMETIIYSVKILEHLSDPIHRKKMHFQILSHLYYLILSAEIVNVVVPFSLSFNHFYFIIIIINFIYLQDKGILLTTYDIVRNNSKSLRGDYYFDDDKNEDSVTWDYMILDEVGLNLLGIVE